MGQVPDQPRARPVLARCNGTYLQLSALDVPRRRGYATTLRLVSWVACARDCTRGSRCSRHHVHNLGGYRCQAAPCPSRRTRSWDRCWPLDLGDRLCGLLDSHVPSVPMGTSELREAAVERHFPRCRQASERLDWPGVPWPSTTTTARRRLETPSDALPARPLWL